MSTVTPFQRILFATDFSEPAEYARQYACELASRFQSELHLLHVIVPLAAPRRGPTPLGHVASPPVIAELEASTLRSLRTLVDGQRESHYRVVQVVSVGMPVVEIIRYANEQEINLIVLGMLKRTGFMHLLPGSVSENVVRQARCPVLTVRPQNLPEMAR